MRPRRSGRRRSTTCVPHLRGYAVTRAPAVSGAISFYGPVYLADGWREPPRPDPLGVRAVLETYLGGTPDQVPDRYAAASPVTYVSKQSPPTLLVYGQRDHIVEVRFARRLEARLRDAGVPVALLELPWPNTRSTSSPMA